MYGPGDGLNAGYGTKRLHGVVDVPVNAAFRNFENMAYFKGALACGAPGQAFQLSFSQFAAAIFDIQFWLSFCWRGLGKKAVEAALKGYFILVNHCDQAAGTFNGHKTDYLQ